MHTSEPTLWQTATDAFSTAEQVERMSVIPRRRGRLSLLCLSLALMLTAILFSSGEAAFGGRLALAQEPKVPLKYNKPSRHFKVDRPADLTDSAALTVYLRILNEMAAGYRLSGDQSAANYRTWRRFNKTPYRSATHGERYVNNYANTLGRSYGRFKRVGEMPVGAMLAKDAFAMTSQGDVFLGPLFLMEKMPAGFNPASRNWRYSMIMPDGSVFGRTKGDGSEKVEFCITCHQSAGEENDHLFFVPKKHRVEGY